MFPALLVGAAVAWASWSRLPEGFFSPLQLSLFSPYGKLTSQAPTPRDCFLRDDISCVEAIQLPLTHQTISTTLCWYLNLALVKSHCCTVSSCISLSLKELLFVMSGLTFMCLYVYLVKKKKALCIILSHCPPCFEQDISLTSASPSSTGYVARETQWSTCFLLPSTGITTLSHHTQLFVLFWIWCWELNPGPHFAHWVFFKTC